MTKIQCNFMHHDKFPQYGVAPHDCYYKIGTQIGGSHFHLPENDPPHFVRDKTDMECGTYFCPECLKGKDEFIKDAANGFKDVPLKTARRIDNEKNYCNW